ncbi:MAG: hypothetical protein R3F54_06285 [Alphaproteobacteria bacterium]
MRSWQRHRLLLALAASAFTLAASVTARADQIDGDWCFPRDGRNLHIEGDDIVTPHGTATSGDYTRHAFRYVVPERDPGAGEEILMRQLNDETMVLTRPDGGEETWKRCDFQTSFLRTAAQKAV